MKNKLLLLAVALLTTLGMKAVDQIEEGVDYYIMNVETDQFLGAQNLWGCQNTISEDAGIYQFSLGTADGAPGYNIKNTLMNGSLQYLGTDLYGDKGISLTAGLTSNEGRGTVNLISDEEAHTTQRVDGIWTVENLGGGVFAFKCANSMKWNETTGEWEVEIQGGYLCKSEDKGAKKGYTTFFSQTLTEACHFQVLTYEEALEHMVDKAQSKNVSFNFLIKNPDYCRNQTTTFWNVSADCTNKNLAGGANDNMCAESWHSTFTISQIVKDLPAGRYQLSAQGFYRQDGGDEENMPFAFVGPGENPIAKAMIPLRTGTENSMTEASNSFTAGKYAIPPVKFNLDEKTDLEIGFQCQNKTMWVIWDNIQLMSYSNVKEYATQILADIKYPIEGTASTDVRAAYTQAYDDFKAFVEGITPGVETFDDVDAEYAKFEVAENALKASIEAWSKYTYTADNAQKLYNQITSQTGKYKDNAALQALGAYALGSAATYGPGSVAFGYTFVNGCYEYIINNLALNDAQLAEEVAFLNSLMSDTKKNSTQPGMDVSFLLVNADFKDPTSDGYGWTMKGTNISWNVRKGLSGWPTSEAYCWGDGGSFEIYQVVNNAPAGLYKITVNAFHRPAGTWDETTKVPVALYMGNLQSEVMNIGKGAIENDLVWDEESSKWTDGEIAKNGTNCYYWDGNSAPTDADKEVWKENKNPDPEIQQMIANSVTWTSAGKYNADSKFKDNYLIPNGMDGASIAFSMDRYHAEVYGEVPDEGDGTGTLRIGIKTTESIKNTAWTLWGGFTLTLTGEDPSAMRALLIDKLAEMQELYPTGTGVYLPGPCSSLADSVETAYADYTGLCAEPVALHTFEEYKAAFDMVSHLIGSVNHYMDAYNAFASNLQNLQSMIDGFDPGTDPAKQELKAYAQNIFDAYTGLAGVNLICLDDDLENCRTFEEEKWGAAPDDVTKENIADAAKDAGEGYYISTYAQFKVFYDEVSEKLDCIYLTVDGTSTADAPQNITDQLRNPDLKTSDQWWGDEWVFNNSCGERYQNNFNIYQKVFMPAGFYTLAGFAMDRRGAWTDVLANNAEYRRADASYLYAQVGDNEVIQTDAANALWVAQTENLSGTASTYTVNEVTYYAPNSMSEYRDWMDAREGTDLQFGSEIKFEVPEGGAFAQLGFLRNANESASWFIADEIKLFYAKDAFPEATGIVAPTSIQKFGKADGKYLEKGKIVIYSNGKKFTPAGQILK